MTAGPAIHLHAVEPRSRANGPGVRFVVWLQGCSLGCPGCFNPGTHATGPTRARDVRDVGALVAQIATAHATAHATTHSTAAHEGEHPGAGLEGLTLSGGEPFEQPEAVLALVQGVRAATPLSILAFSGYTLEEIRAQPLGPAILACVDVLVDGRYEASRRLGRGLRGSSNQRIHLLTTRYGMSEVEATPEAEVRIDARGNVVLTGVNPLVLKTTR